MREILQTISRREWRFVALITIVVLVVMAAPYLYGWLMTPPGMVYTGLHGVNPADASVYNSYIYQIKTGRTTVRDLFTAESVSQDSGSFDVWWWLVGLLARLGRMSPPVAAHVSRLLMIPLFIATAYIFISYFFAEIKKRRLWLLLILFSSGIGFYFAAPFDQIFDPTGTTYRWPIDLWITEAFSFTAMYQSSHFIVSITLTLLIFLLSLLAFQYNRWSYAVYAGLLALVYFNFHPYYAPTIYGTLLLYLISTVVLEKKIVWCHLYMIVVVIGISLPSLAYHVFMILSDPVIGQRALQNVTPISPIGFIIIGYGFLFIGACIGMVVAVRLKLFRGPARFLLIWGLVNVALIYSSFPFHSRYTQGLQIIFAFFFTVAVFEVARRLETKINPVAYEYIFRNRSLVFVLFALCLMSSNLYTVVRDLSYYTWQPEGIRVTFYIDRGWAAAMRWLEHQPANQVVLAPPTFAIYIPGYSGQLVYLAHSHETLFPYAKLEYLNWFYEHNDQDKARRIFLEKNGINFVAFTQEELGSNGFDPSRKDYLRLAFDSPTIKIYEVVTQ